MCRLIASEFFGTQTIPGGAASLPESATCPVIFAPEPTSTFMATPPLVNLSPATAFALIFFFPAETTIAYWPSCNPLGIKHHGVVPRREVPGAKGAFCVRLAFECHLPVRAGNGHIHWRTPVPKQRKRGEKGESRMLRVMFFISRIS